MARMKRKENGTRESAGDTMLVGIDRERLSQRAYERYLARGGEHGQDLEDWLAAERELRGAPGPTNPER
jgi:hypothetical protein